MKAKSCFEDESILNWMAAGRLRFTSRKHLSLGSLLWFVMHVKALRKRLWEFYEANKEHSRAMTCDECSPATSRLHHSDICTTQANRCKPMRLEIAHQHDDTEI